jgi:hypothetical protein
MARDAPLKTRTVHSSYRRWRLALRLLLALIGMSTVAIYLLIAATINQQASIEPFRGWLAVLVPTDSLGDIQNDQVKLRIEAVVPGAPGEHPALAYFVIVCGQGAFNGVLLIGGDAQLTNGFVTRGPGTGTYPVDSLADVTFAQRSMADLGAVQLVHLTLPSLDRCAAEFSPDRPQTAFGGQAFEVVGLARARVQRNGGLGWWSGPRSSQVWPSVGAIPGFDVMDAGSFTGIRGLQGEWSRPFRQYLQINVGGLTGRASLDEARPQPLSGTDLVWASVSPLQPSARLTNAYTMSDWQQRLVAAGILFGIGGSILAALLLELISPLSHVLARVGRHGSTGSSSRPVPDPGPDVRSSLKFIAFVFVLVVLLRRRSR